MHRTAVSRHVVAAVACLWAAGSAARAQDVPEEIVVVGEADATDLTTTSSQVTIVRVDDTLPASADVATAVERAPGTTVQRLGGLGDLAQVGIRGASARQVEVILDGIPLNPEGGAAVDLSELPLRGFERIEIYRGAAPALVGTGAMGGAVQLVTGDEPQLRGAMSAGSYRTARTTALASGSAGPFDVWASADALTTSGRFRWFVQNDPLTSEDDEVARRANNDARQLATVVRARLGKPDQLRLTLLHTGLWRSDGLPGTTFDPPADAARYVARRHLGALRAEGAVGPWHWSARLHGLTRDEILDDRAAEIGLTPDWALFRTSSLGARVTARGFLAPWLRLDTAVGAQTDRFVTEDRLLRVVPPPMGRAVGRIVTAAALGPSDVRTSLTPTLMALAVDARGLDGGDRQLQVLPRVGWRHRLGDGETVLKANAGASARPPDPVELFGDRGTLVGNPALLPERAWAADLGLAGRHGATRGEVVAFGRTVRDLIVWGLLPQGVVRADNVDRAMIVGVELAGGVGRGAVEVSGQATVQRAVNRSALELYRGAQLPQVPVLDGQLRASVQPGPVRIATDLSGSTSAFADPGNLRPLGARLLWGATVTAWAAQEHLAVELDVRNVLDQLTVNVAGRRTPMADFAGYPLPGRTFLLTLRAQR